MNRFTGPVLALAFALLSVAACSSDSSSSAPATCDQNPYSCPNGKTCWVADAAPTFKCITSGAGKEGDACRNTIGSPTCNDGLMCLMGVGASGGVCTAYCDAAHPCPSGETCQRAQISNGTMGTGPIIAICNPGPHADAGADASADAPAEGAADAPAPSDATGQ